MNVYLLNAGVFAGGLAASTSIGLSIYDYHTFDKYLPDQKTALLNKKMGGNVKYLNEADFNILKAKYSLSKNYNEIAGITEPNTQQTYITDAGLASLNIAKMTYVHESRHSYEFSLGFDSSLPQYEAYASSLEYTQINSFTPSRYIDQANNSIISSQKLFNKTNNVPFVKTYDLYKPSYSNKIFNIIR